MDRKLPDLRRLRQLRQEKTPPEARPPRPTIAAMFGESRGTNFDHDGQPPTGGMRPPR